MTEDDECKSTLAGYLLSEGDEEGSGANLDEQELRDHDIETIAGGQTVALATDLS